MNPCTKALYVSVIIRWDSAAIVENTSELFPDPETPVKTVSRRLGSSTLTSRRLFSRAPCTRIRSCESAGWLVAAAVDFLVSALVIGISSSGSARFLRASGQPSSVAHERTAGDLVRLAPGLDAN